MKPHNSRQPADAGRKPAIRWRPEITSAPSRLDRFWAAACLTGAFAWWLMKLNGWTEMSALGRLMAGLLPAGPFILSNLGRSLSAIFLAGLLFLLYDSAGTMVSRIAIGRNPSGPARLAVAPLAYGLMSLSLLGTAALGLWRQPVLPAILAIFLLAGLPDIRKSFRFWREGAANIWASSGLLARAGWITAGALAILFASTPEVHPDCAQYHLAFPQQLLRLGRLPWGQVFWFWMLPLPVEMPYAFPLLARNENISIFMMLAFGGTSALALVKSLQFRVPAAAAAAVALAGLALHDNCWTAFTAKNDLGSVAFGLAGASMVIASGGYSRKGPLNRGQLLLGAVLLGFCGAAKFVLMPLAGILAFLPLVIRGSGRPVLALLSGAGLLIPLLPWMVRSYIQCGDPLFPAGTLALPGILGIPARNADLIREFLLVQEKRAPGYFLSDTGRAALQMCPILLAGLPALIRARAWWAILPVAALLPGISSQFLLMPASSWAVYRFDYLAAIIWNLAGFSALAGSAPLPGGGTRPAPLGQGPAFFAAGLALLVGFSHSAYWQEASYQGYIDRASYSAGRVSAEEYRTHGLFSYGVIMPDMNRNAAGLPPGSSVIEVAETLAWDSPLRVRTDTVGPPPIWSVFAESDSISRVRARFHQLNARQVVYNSERNQYTATACEPYPWDTRMLSLYLDFARTNLRLISSSGKAFDQYGTLWLYEILPRPAPALKRVLFLPGAERGFCRMKQSYYAKSFQEAVNIGVELRTELPGLVLLDARLGEVLLMAGETEKGFQLLNSSVSEGLVHGRNLTQALLGASILGRKKDMDRLYKMHMEWYPTRREDADAIINTMGKRYKKGDAIPF